MAERATEPGALVGATLDDVGGATVGRIDGLLVDAVDGSPSWLLVRTGRGGRFGRRGSVPFDFAAAGAGRVWAPYSRDEIRGSAEIDPTRGLTCGQERELGFHFGIPERAGRLAAIADRGDEEPGSVPD